MLKRGPKSYAVIMIHKDGYTKVYGSIGEAAKQTGLNPKTLWGHIKTGRAIKGMFFDYAIEGA